MSCSQGVSFVDKEIMRTKKKLKHELAFWERRIKDTLFSDYVYFFTDYFGFKKEFFYNKKILDIGCGPLGTLEWANMTLQRIGVDPLANDYKRLGIKQQMTYVTGCAEELPFKDNYFDVVSSFNSLDHVDDIDKSISEIIRVAGGYFLLLVDVNHRPTRYEPQKFSWDILEKFIPVMTVLSERHYRKTGIGIYYDVLNNNSYVRGKGILSAKLKKIEI